MFAVCCSTTALATAAALARRSCVGPAKCRAAGAAASYASVASSAPARVAGAFGGVKVVSADDSASDACVLSVALPAGARHQRVGEPGLAHHHKNWAFTGTFTNTTLAITREAEIHGGSLTSNLTREALFLTAEFHRKDFKFFLELLRDVAYLTQYNLHEAEFVNDVISQEAARASKCPDAVVCGALHKTAFRTGLGNSLYTQPVHVTPDDVAAFGARAKGEVAVAAAGVGSAEVQQSVQDAFGPGFAALRERLQEKAGSRMADRLAPPSAPAKLQASKYFGGEDRIDAPLDDGHLAVAYPTGASIGSQTEAVAQVLKAHLDSGAPVSYALSHSALGKVSAKIGADISAFNFAYSDCGILGVRVRCPEDRAGDAVKGAVAEIKRAAESLSDEELKIAVTRAKIAALRALQSKASLVEYMGSRALAGSQVTGVAGLIANLDSVKSADVTKLAATMLKSKPTFVAYGNTPALPFADSL